MSDATIATVQRVLSETARLSTPVEELGPEASLYEAGMTSHASVNVMLALEDAFDVEFPDEMLTREVFETTASIAAALDRLTAGVAQ